MSGTNANASTEPVESGRQAPCRLLALPRELRDEIWQYVFAKSLTIRVFYHIAIANHEDLNAKGKAIQQAHLQSGQHHPFALLGTNRQIHNEASQYRYDGNLVMDFQTYQTLNNDDARFPHSGLDAMVASFGPKLDRIVHVVLAPSDAFKFLAPARVREEVEDETTYLTRLRNALAEADPDYYNFEVSQAEDDAHEDRKQYLERIEKARSLFPRLQTVSVVDSDFTKEQRLEEYLTQVTHRDELAAALPELSCVRFLDRRWRSMDLVLGPWGKTWVLEEYV